MNYRIACNSETDDFSTAYDITIRHKAEKRHVWHFKGKGTCKNVNLRTSWKKSTIIEKDVTCKFCLKILYYKNELIKFEKLMTKNDMWIIN